MFLYIWYKQNRNSQRRFGEETKKLLRLMGVPVVRSLSNPWVLRSNGVKHLTKVEAPSEAEALWPQRRMRQPYIVERVKESRSVCIILYLVVLGKGSISFIQNVNSLNMASFVPCNDNDCSRNNWQHCAKGLVLLSAATEKSSLQQRRPAFAQSVLVYSVRM